MTDTEISAIVAAALDGENAARLEDIAAHGIHNMGNDYDGANAEAFALEFRRSASAALAAIEAASAAEFWAA